MKTVIVMVFLVFSVSLAFASGSLEVDSKHGMPIQGFAPNGLYSGLLTVNSITIDGTTRMALDIYSPIDAKIRLMATTSKTGSVSHTLIGGQRTTIIINRATPFVNISGATGGDYMAQ